VNYDVVIADGVSTPDFNPRIAEERGLGGVEWTLMLLADALGAAGYRVLVLHRGSAFKAGRVEYGHIARAYESKIACAALVCSRWTAPPPIIAPRVVFSYHDIPERWMFAGAQRRFLDEGAVAVCVSSWLSGKVGEIDTAWRRVVIAPMLLDECYEFDAAAKDQNKMVYASAAIKGAPETLDVWEEIREHFSETHWGELFMAINGYDDLSAKDVKRMNEIAVRRLGQLPARRIIHELRTAAGLFFVNTFRETHCIIASTALALGCRLHILTPPDPAALPETTAGAPLVTSSKHAFIEDYVRAFLSPRDPRWVLPRERVPDRRARALLPLWEEVLFG
jgi:hypothetical protein